MREKKKTVVKPLSDNNRWHYLLLILSVLIAFGAALNCNFTNWDDQYYVSSNKAITSWSADHLKNMLFGFTAGNYHPLTMLSLSLDYFLHHKNPAGYHLTNLLFHIANTLLVFLLVKQLSKRKDIAFLVALFFGIQPMHAESVVWISERKDLLYTFFLLLALLAYVKLPVDSIRYSFKNYGLVIVYFLLSLLSKGQAVVFPLLLLLIDYYRGEIKIKSRWFEKIPLLLLSIGFGLLAIQAQHSTDAMVKGMKLDVVHRLLAAGSGFFTYAWKAILPIQLSCLHPYPKTLAWDMSFYLETIAAIALMIFVFIKRNSHPKVFFGMLFFLIALLPVLQLLPVGNAMVAERYSYVPYIGLFFALFSLLPQKDFFKVPQFAIPILITAVIFIALSWNRCDVWKNTFTLWSDVIDKYPECAIAYCNRGVALSEEKQFDLAEKDFNQAVQCDSMYREAFNNLGLICNNSGRSKEALNYFSLSIKADPKFDEAYNNRGVALARAGRTKEALIDFKKCVSLNPEYAAGWLNEGNALLENQDTVAALADMNKAAALYSKQENQDGYANVQQRISSFSQNNR